MKAEFKNKLINLINKEITSIHEEYLSGDLDPIEFEKENEDLKQMRKEVLSLKNDKHTREEAIEMLVKYWSDNFGFDYKIQSKDELDIQDIMTGDHTRLTFDPFKYMESDTIKAVIKSAKELYT